MLCPIFPEYGFNFVNQKISKFENCYFETLRTLAFELDVDSKLFSRMLLKTNFYFTKFSKVFLAFPKNCFNFVTYKLAKKCKI